MKFQDTSIHRLKVKKKEVRTHGRTDPRTHGQAQSNMPYQLFQSWGHKNVFRNGQKQTKSAEYAICMVPLKE